MEASIQTGPQSAVQTSPLPALEAIDVRKSLPLGRDQIEILRGVSRRVARGGEELSHGSSRDFFFDAVDPQPRHHSYEAIAGSAKRTGD